MNRTPIPNPPDSPPPAFGPNWAARRSLSELAAEARAALSSEAWRRDDGGFGMYDLYSKMYAKYVGRALSPKPAARLAATRAVDAASQFCNANGLDLPLYIAAQMVALRDWADAHAGGFQPRMLLGPKALGRYNAYARRLGRRFHHASEGAASSADAGVRAALADDEVSVGSALSAQAINGALPDWGEAVEGACPGPEWLAATGGMKAATKEARGVYGRLLAAHGPEWLPAALRLARLEAACAVAGRLYPGLADRVGVGKAGFDWVSFAELMGSMFSRRDAVDAPALLGLGLKNWGN